MNRKNQVIVTGIFWLLGIVGLFYAASRTLHFVETTMPSGDKLNGYLYLFFTGGGAFLWAQIYLKHAVGATRRATAFMLAVGDLLAEMILVYADTQYVANANGLVSMSQDELKIFITATVGIVALNLIGWFIYHLNDPEHRKANMAQDLADEVEEATYKQLNTPGERQAMIANLMPTLGGSILADVTKNIHERAGYTPVQGTVFEKKEAATSAMTIPHPTTEIPHWECSNCGEYNFMHYTACIKCGTERTAAFIGSDNKPIYKSPTAKDEQTPAPSPFPSDSSNGGTSDEPKPS